MRIPKISQSLIRELLNEDSCKRYVYEVFWNQVETPSSITMKKGLLFESLLIGSSRGGVYDGEDFPKLKSGKPTKGELDVRQLAESSKDVLKDMGIEPIDVQPEWETDTLIGHPDLTANYKGEKILIDIKYTETKEDDNVRWNPFAWGGDIRNKDYTQAIHYVYMCHLITGEYLPFYYLIFGKSGWVKFVRVKIKPETLEMHKNIVKNLEEDVLDFQPYPINDYSVCKKCSLFDICDEATKLPNQIEVIV